MTSPAKLLFAALAVALAGCASTQPPLEKSASPDILPLSIDESFQIRKILTSVFDPEIIETPTTNRAIQLERMRRTWGAVDAIEVAQRYGSYFTVFWRNKETADVTVRLEYRQAGLANTVLSMERTYPATRGSHRTTFEVVGDDFLEFGRVTAWRLLLVVDGRIVNFKQSFMWR